MAQKKKAKAPKATKPASASATVTRVRASDSKPATKKAAPKVKKEKETKPVKAIEVEATAAKPLKKRRTIRPGAALKPAKATGGYFKGAWLELKQVRWPTRRATWSMTLAVLLYSAFFVVLVLLLDAGFKYVFQLILGK